MPFSDMHIDLLRSIIHEAAERQIVPRFRELHSDDIGTKKSSIDVVTQADILAEERITHALEVNFPGALIIGEEAHAKRPEVLNGLADAQLAFVIDPVDGTLNFVKGLPLFGTILSVVSKGETIAGLIYDPLNRTFLIASRGAGARQAFSDGHEVRVKAAAPVPLEEMSGVLCLMFYPEADKARVAANITKLKTFHAVNSAVYDYWMVATGAAHFTANFSGMYWDHLAGTLIHTEAGGYSAHFDGMPYDGRGEPANILSAPDKESWEVVKREILGL
jgi:myo-inositol-1(or 4)-monophosphatase